MSSQEINSAFNKILVIDDDEFLNELFCQFLQDKGFLTDSAYSLAQAKEYFQKKSKIDLILLDHQLNDGTGMDFLVNKAGYLDEHQIPTIMISGNEDPMFLESCFSVGVADYIIKPVNLSLLALKVDALIKSVAMQRIITQQNDELEKFKLEAQREEEIAKFTYEYVLRQNNQCVEGVSLWLKPTTSFSGDIALVKESPSGDLYFLLADATGHGLSAAITIMPVVAIFNSMVEKGFHIQSIVTEINRRLIRDTPDDRFVAAIMIQMTRHGREIEVWNGGMPTAYWVYKGELVHEFKSRHMALGILSDDLFDANVEACKSYGGGTIVAYSDGLIEETNDQGAPFSVSRLLEIITATEDSIQQQLIESLVNHSGRDNYRDDVSICTIDPNLFFSSSLNLLSRDRLDHEVINSDGGFLWKIKLSGLKISSCEIPPLCSQFLKAIDVNQSFCQVIFMVVAEMVNNAIDHGVLKLESSIKELPNGFVQYFEERERRLAQLTESDYVELSLKWGIGEKNSKLKISVRDSGKGYDFKSSLNPSEGLYSGRGLQLIRSIAEKVEVVSPGNLINVTLIPH